MEKLNISKKSNTILAISIILLLLLGIIGVTYAYFNVIVINPVGSSMNVGIKNLGNVVFADGSEIELSNIFPGTTDIKEFTITRSDASDQYEMEYSIYLVVRQNTLTANADSEFVYSLSGTKTDTGVLASATNVVVPTSTSQIGNNGKFIGNGVHTYTFTIGLNETGSNQNSTRGMGFSGYLQVATAKKYAYQSSDEYAYTLFIDSRGGVLNGSSVASLDTGDTLQIESPTKTGYIFAGWSLVGTGSSINGSTFTMGTSNATLTANWYISTDLALLYDGINNSSTGHNASATSWYDLSGNSNNGTITGATFGANYLSFDGTDDFVQLPNLTSALPKTYEFIFLTSSITTNQIIFGDFTNKISFGVYSQGYITSIATSRVLFQKNQSSNTIYAVSLTANSASSKILKINNNEISALSSSSYWTWTDSNSYIGKRASGTYFSGKMYAFRVYNRALTADEIKSNYETDKMRFGLQ